MGLSSRLLHKHPENDAICVLKQQSYRIYSLISRNRR